MPDPAGFSVMTMNLRFGLADDGDNSWPIRKKAYKLLFNTYQPDFIGVQEANNFQTQYLSTILEDYAFIGMRKPSPEFWQNNILFYKKQWSCHYARHCFLSETPDTESRLPDSKWPRQCTIGLFENLGSKIILVNTHFDFLETVQKKSAQLILEFLLKLPENISTVITGDFNSPAHSTAHKIFTDNRFIDILAGKHTYTFHGFTGQDKGGHIDWILYRGALGVHETAVIKDEFDGIYPSDHFPVLARFNIN